MKAIKRAILIHDDDSLTDVQGTVLEAKFGEGEQSTRGVTVNGQAFTPPAANDGVQVGDKITGDDGNVYTIVAHDPSEMETALFKVIGINQGKANPNQTDGGKPAKKVKVRPGDDLPIPGAKEIINVELEQPLGIAAYGWNVPAGVKGRGWIKGRAASGDDFAVRYALLPGQATPEQLGSAVGSMELPINFDGDEKGGMSNTGPGFKGKLTVDNVAGKPIVLQLTRD